MFGHLRVHQSPDHYTDSNTCGYVVTLSYSNVFLVFVFFFVCLFAYLTYNLFIYFVFSVFYFILRFMYEFVDSKFAFN